MVKCFGLLAFVALLACCADKDLIDGDEPIILSLDENDECASHGDCAVNVLQRQVLKSASSSDTNETIAHEAYVPAKAMEYASLSGAAYCSANSLRHWSCGEKCISGVTSARVCKGSSTHAVVGYLHGVCFAAFEGTNGDASALEDIETWKRHWDGPGMVHSGMYGEWESLRGCVKESLKSIGCGPGSKLGCTGHSLGAAISALATWDLQVNGGWHVVELYNFGMPRVGNHEFVEAFDRQFHGKIFRVTHGRDPFVDLPFGPWYKHIEPEVFYWGDASYGFKICYHEFDHACSSQYFPEGWNVFRPSRVAYHHTYLGVTMGSGACRSSGHEPCNGDIPGSWCTAIGSMVLIDCNHDTRGAQVYCDTKTHKCRCHHGYCQSNGRCVKKR